MAKKNVSSRKTPETPANADPIIDSPEQALSLLYQAEAESTAEMFKNEEQEQKDQNELAQELTKKEMEALMNITDHADAMAEALMNPKPKKRSKK